MSAPCETSSRTINHVGVFSRPQASKYSQARLALTVNPAVKRSAVLKDVFAAEGGAEKKRYNSSQLRMEQIRNCPQCANELYHTNVFQIPWVSLCPIHHARLVTACPKCSSSWMSGLDSLKNVCVQCGCVFRFRDVIERTAHKKGQYLPIETLNEVLADLKKELLCCAVCSEKNLIYSTQDERSYCVSALLLNRNEKYNELLRSFGFTSRNAVLICDNISIDNSVDFNREEYISNDRFLSFKEKAVQYCLDLASSLHTKEHQASISDKSQYLDQHDLCPVCYASTLTVGLINQCTSNNTKCHFPSEFLPGSSTRISFASPLFGLSCEDGRIQKALLYSEDLILKVFIQQVCSAFFSILRYILILQRKEFAPTSLSKHEDGPWLEPWFQFEYAATKDKILFAFPKPIIMRDESYPSAIVGCTVGKRHKAAVYRPR